MEQPQVRQRRGESPKPQGNTKPPEGAKSGDAAKSRFLDKFQRVPVQCNGLALGLFGLAGVVLNLHVLLIGPATPFDSNSASAAWLLACAAFLLAVLNQATYLAKLMAAPRVTWQADFCSVATFAGQVTPLTIAFGSVTFGRLTASWPGLKTVVEPMIWSCVCCAVVMQMAGMVRFYLLVHRESHSRSVVFFPPSVSIAAMAVTGGAVGIAGELIALSAWASVAVMLWLFPVVLWRTVRNRDQAANPSIGLLMAPCAMVTLAWHTAKKTSPGAGPWLGPYVVGDVLFALSVLGVAATIYCSFQRAQALRTTWFSSPWAAYTFPAASNANVALMQAMARPHPLATTYAIVLCAVVIPLILTINIAHIIHLARVLGSPSKVVAEEKQKVEGNVNLDKKAT